MSETTSPLNTTRFSPAILAGLALILLVYLFVGALYAIYTPAWQTPDEPAHYNYVRALADTRRLPVIEPGDYDQAYQTHLVFESKFAPGLSVAPLRYEDWQPPLYYLLAAPLFVWTDGALVALRLFSLLIGGGVVLLAFLVVRQALPAEPELALATTAFVAFVPQHMAIMAGVNNDGLTELLLATVMWQTLGLTGAPTRAAWRDWGTVGVLLGLGMLTKLSFYIALPLVGWAWLRRWRLKSTPLTSLLSSAFIVLPALALTLPWWLRNIVVYGWPDLLGLAAHNAVVVGQPTSAGWIAQYGWDNLIERFATFTFQSFWGQFGWMTTPMPARYYLVLGAFSLAVALGLFGAWAPRFPGRRAASSDAPAPPGVVDMSDVRFQILAGWLALTILMYLYYNLTFVQHQGRYLFPALIPIGLLFGLGWRQWTLALPRAGVWRRAALALPYLGMAGLDVLALFRVILPALR